MTVAFNLVRTVLRCVTRGSFSVTVLASVLVISKNVFKAERCFKGDLAWPWMCFLRAHALQGNTAAICALGKGLQCTSLSPLTWADLIL